MVKSAIKEKRLGCLNKLVGLKGVMVNKGVKYKGSGASVNWEGLEEGDMINIGVKR